MQFISEKIEVTKDEKLRTPVSFLWRGKEYKIKEVTESRADWGFSKGAPKKKSWRLRHHRNYYKVKTDRGEIFEIYLDRKDKKNEEWILYQKIN
ncbi:MAG: hypothetical protein AMJ90_01165 [candidate division Zixibacteria bacterium SM23_73_2]|nr:MAG: hypothetical protein AMJ90_01165 [candidate division Zixibacteria bacterium SM23_73_2]